MGMYQCSFNVHSYDTYPKFLCCTTPPLSSLLLFLCSFFPSPSLLFLLFPSSSYSFFPPLLSFLSPSSLLPLSFLSFFYFIQVLAAMAFTRLALCLPAFFLYIKKDGNFLADNHNDVGFCAAIGVFSFGSGYLVTSAFQLAPSTVPEAYRAQVANLCSVAFQVNGLYLTTLFW